MKKSKIWKLLIYFIIYSILGFLLETFYAIFTEGIFESRKSFIYGPFCIVYGIGAIILINLLNKYKNNTIKLFFYGIICGSIIEYFSSYIGELILHVKWWDYSNYLLNINGRTCIFYGIMWGFLSIFLIKYFNPTLEISINYIFRKISNRLIKFSVSFITLFMIIDGILSVYALNNFLIRISNNYNIDIKGINKEEIANIYFEENFSDDKMMMTYPNIIIVNDEGEKLYLETVLAGKRNYYYKFKDN